MHASFFPSISPVQDYFQSSDEGTLATSMQRVRIAAYGATLARESVLQSA